MREIKFRAWDVKEGRMLEDYPAPDDYGDINNIFDSWKDEYIPMQYTGLKDKSNREIYEGDIIRHESDRWSEKVEWKENMWTEEGFMTGFGEFVGTLDQYTVIGNIYENPELLGEE